MLELKDISYTLPDGKEILKHIDLTVKDNEFMVITGPNGGGKSTLAKVVMGILTPTSGRIYLDGRDITDLDITNRANIGISFAFQQPVRFKGITVRDLLSLASNRDLSTREACELLTEVGLREPNMSSGRWMPPSPAESSSVLKSPSPWPGSPNSRSSTSRRQASTSGASRT